MTDLWLELRDKNILLGDCIRSLKEQGMKHARADHDYKISLRLEIFELHEKDKVAWTACISMAHGDTDRHNVSQKRLERDLAKTKYDVLQEKINGLKLEMRIIESQLSREWGQAK